MEVKLQYVCICLVTLFVIDLPSPTESKSVTLYDVPSSARSGYIVTFLSSPGDIGKETDSWVQRLFSVREDGALMLRGLVEHLNGQTVHLVITHKKEYHRQPTHIYIRISDDMQTQKHYFHGYVYSDQPVGSRVEGLDDLYSLSDKAHHSHFVLKERSEAFELVPFNNGFHLLTKASFSHNEKESYNLIIETTRSIDAPTTFIQVNIQVRSREIPLKDEPTDQHSLVKNTIMKFAAENENVFRSVDDSVEEHSRMRRAVLAERVFVVRREVTGDLFTVAADISDPTAKFYFKEPAPERLSLNADTGMVSLKSGQQWNATVNEERFTVNVTTSTGQSKDELPVLIKLVDRTQYDPIFSNTPFPLFGRVRMWTRPNTLVYTVHSIDKAMGAMVKYRLETGGDFRFRVDEDTGEVFTLGRLPFLDQDYILTISARDIGAPPTSTTITQTLIIRGGTRDPQFTEPQLYEVNMKETTTVGSVVLQVVAKAFQENPIAYSMRTEDGGVSEEFSITSTTGDIKLLKKLNYAFNPHQYRLNVTATETASGFTSTILVIINLIDENDHNPVFGPLVFTSETISETVSTGYTVVQVSVSDLDAGDNGQVTYSVDDPHFLVETVNNVGIIKTQMRLDYDLSPQHMYDFTVTATDKGVPPRSGTAKVHVPLINANDESPQFDPANQTVYLNEEASSGTLVHVVQAHDPDGDRITFEFTGGNANGLFSINSNTGEIRTNRKVTLEDKKTSEYVLGITAIDDNSCCGNSGSRLRGYGNVFVVLIGVNHPPAFPNCDNYNQLAQVQEEKPIGTPVINATAVDEDSGPNGQLSYSLSIPYGAIQYFSIDKSTAELRTFQIFKREVPTGGYEYSHGVTVNATDRGVPALSGVCYLQVKIIDTNDNTPFMVEEIYYSYISTAANRVIRVYAFDRDEGQNAEVTYSMTQPSNCANCFQINSDTGVISRTGTLTANTAYKVTVTAQDRGSPPRLTKAHDVNIFTVSSDSELAPTWDNQNDLENQVISIQENSSISHPVVTLKATPYNGGGVVYTVLQGPNYMWELNGKGNFGKRVSADGETVTITTLLNLDYESINRYFIRVRAAPSGNTNDNLYNDIRLQVNILDVNDRIPEFVGLDGQGKYSTTVTLDTEVGKEVLKIRANDLDGTSPNNLVRYRWKGNTSDYAAFNLNRDTGVVTTARNFTGLRGKEYVLSVVAYDGAPAFDSTNNEPNSQEATVTIVISGPSDNPPYFSLSRYDFQEVAGAPHGKLIGTITAANAASLPNLQYTFSSGNDNHLFAVDVQKGQITVAASFLPYFNSSDPYNTYTLTYRVFDGRESNTTTVNIRVSPTNLHPPVFAQNVYQAVAVAEDTQPAQGQRVLLTSVSATDPDFFRNNQITYRLEGNVDMSSFQIDGTNVYLTKPLDRDYPYGYETWMINVVAADEPNSSGPKRGYCIVRISPTDRNDHPPVFDTCCLRGTVDENAAAGTSVMTVVATDVDYSENARIRYSKVDSADASVFLIDTNTGTITTTRSLDRETKASYEFVVKATDNGSPTQLSTDQKITVQVGDKNDNAPGFAVKQYTFSMPEDVPIGGYVGTVFAEDIDVGINAVRLYSIDPTSNHFYVDSIFSDGSGIIKVKTTIDYDTSHLSQ